MSECVTCLPVKELAEAAGVVKCCCLRDECLLLHDQFGGGTRIDQADGSNENPIQGCSMLKSTTYGCDLE